MAYIYGMVVVWNYSLSDGGSEMKYEITACTCIILSQIAYYHKDKKYALMWVSLAVALLILEVVG